jgi:hypothetical protein
MRTFVQETLELKNESAPDDLSIVLGFTEMLTGAANMDEVSRRATDQGWIDARGQLTVSGHQLADALLLQRGTRTIFRVW